MKKLPNSYQSGTLTSGYGGGATVHLHFSNVDEAEQWFNGLTAEAAEQREQVTPGALPKFRFWLHLGDRVQEVNHQVMLQGDTINVTAFPTEKQLSTPPTPPAGVPDGWIDSVKEAIRALEVYESLPRHSYPGPPTTALAGLRAMLSAAQQPEDIPAIFKEQAS